MGGPCLDDGLLAAFAAGSLTATELGSAEEHVASCGDCRRLLAVARSSRDASTLAPTTTSDDGHLVPGTLVGRYEIESLVGAGSMGRVYSAHDPALGRRVAIKILRAPGDAEPDRGTTARMKREAQAMARLSHPNVVTVFDVGTFDGRVFVAMEFVQGTTLRAWLARNAPSWQDVLTAFEDAGRGLAAAHAAGLVHRDFKPDNVLVGDDGRVRVTDFGLVRSVGDAETPTTGAMLHGEIVDATLTRTGTLVGTPAYMSPEALALDAVDARSDVFSFCVALHEGLYGVRPFTGTNVGELRAAVDAGRVHEPTTGTPVPPAARRAILAGLAPSPEARPQSMRLLLDLLAAVPRRDASARRRRAWGVGVAAIAVAAAGVFTLVPSRAPQTPAAAPAVATTPPAPDPVSIAAPIPPVVPAPTETLAPPPPTAAPSASPRARPSHPVLPARAKPSLAPEASSAETVASATPAPTVVFGTNGAPILH